MKLPAKRCAIYARKSSEEGLEQGFNSLHAQREACEAYVRSQVGDGWTLIPKVYDDGGFSGGNLERPALQELLADVERGKLDIVVVYKVDRLTRSLTDFSKIVDRFDRHRVSFVSITQSFNTTTSMGRLTLNVLLSFAQFEREVTGERIRDKIAASKQKGLWMGGVVPLGYEPAGRTLSIVAEEAAQVRLIFQRYLALRSVPQLAVELEEAGYRSKRWRTRAGDWTGGVVFTRGALYRVLTNRLYLGEIVHKEKTHPGVHPPILDAETFDQVQQALEANRVTWGVKRSPAGRGMLMGRIFGEQAEAMIPSTSYGANGRRYRYYVSSIVLKGRGAPAPGQIVRLAANATEALVADQIRRLLDRPAGEAASDCLKELQRFDIGSDHLRLTLAGGDEGQIDRRLRTINRRARPGEVAFIAPNGQSIVVELPVRAKLRGGAARVEAPNGLPPTPNRRRQDRRLWAALRKAHKALRVLQASPWQSASVLAAGAAPESSYARRLCRLGYLAPDIQLAILEGRQPGGLTLQSLLNTDIPIGWQDQRRTLGFVAPLVASVDLVVSAQGGQNPAAKIEGGG
jgi:site-specific DNA recombinase